MATDKLITQLDEWWEAMRILKVNSPQEDWNKYAQYLNPDALIYVNGVGSPPARGIAAAIAELKKIDRNLGYYRAQSFVTRDRYGWAHVIQQYEQPSSGSWGGD